jgi:hypothetical protein
MAVPSPVPHRTLQANCIASFGKNMVATPRVWEVVMRPLTAGSVAGGRHDASLRAGTQP